MDMQIAYSKNKKGANINMKCSFCGASGVKVNAIMYNSKLALVCVSCELLDGITDDNGGATL